MWTTLNRGNRARSLQRASLRAVNPKRLQSQVAKQGYIIAVYGTLKVLNTDENGYIMVYITDGEARGLS